ncbi:TonB-dependent receptor [Lysobacter psychrotolerans]|uniref:TonB-dependent receptor n=1 Tax=Montanilutibacter psychrotolerans TaxID=1327343 RepID=A0A3M8SVX2_9GAMM|nr:TonB-dependent receptor [Lysobacter psychrotolerans]
MLAALVMPVAGVAFAQDAPQSAPADASAQQDLDTVVVTGSRIKRVDIEGPSPVTVITADQIEKQGFSTVYDALNTLSQFTGSVQNELTQSGFTPNASFLNLRGLGPGYQLVLINGRRAADYPLPYNGQSNAVNLANIPAAAIERIEVLSGGASAIYGSDAVAGVVNIIMKTNYDGNLLTVRGGTSSRGGGDTGRVQWVGGTGGDNWNLTYAFEYLAREAIFASQREFMDSYRDDPLQGPPVEGIRVRDRLQPPRTPNRIWPVDAAETCSKFADFETFTLPNNLGTGCGYYGFPATQQIRNSDDTISGYLYGTLDFTDNLQGMAQLSFSDSKAKIASSTQFWQSPLYVDQQYGTIVDAQRIFTPSEVGGLGAQQTRVNEKAFDLAFGLRGTVFNGRFDWDATVSHAEYRVDSKQPRFLASAINDYFLGEQLGVVSGRPVYDLNEERYFSPLSPDVFQSLITTVNTEAESKVDQASFVFSGDLFELPAGPLGMAATVEAARQQYDLVPDPRIHPDVAEIYNLTGTGGGGERNRYAAGVEFSIPVFSTLKANLAGRYDKYDDATDVDDAVTMSAGLEWRPIDSLLFRGNYATSFRAPDMHYVFADESGFFQTVTDEYGCRQAGIDPTDTACTGSSTYTYSVFGTRSGNPDLEEEEGKSWSAGVVWDATDSLSMSVDWYKIRLEKQVSDISSSYLLRNEADCRLGRERDGTPVDSSSAACQKWLSMVDRVPSGPDQGDIDAIRRNPINQSSIETSGIDAKVAYELDTDRHGNFRATLAWTHVLKLEEQEFEGEPIVNTRDHLSYFNFRSRVNWQLDWERDDWAVSLYGYRWGSLPNWEETGRIGSYVIWNAGVRKEITDKASISVAVNNVFDKLHPEDNSFNTYPYFWRAYSPIGREIFVQLDYKFN